MLNSLFLVAYYTIPKSNRELKLFAVYIISIIDYTIPKSNRELKLSFLW